MHRGCCLLTNVRFAANIPPMDSFLDRVTAEMTEVARAEAALAAQEDGIRRRRAELSERLNALATSAAMYREVMGIDKPEAPSRPLFEEGALPKGSVSEMAYAAIQKHGSPMQVADVTKALIAAQKFDGNDYRQHYATTYGILTKDKKFVKVAPGQFEIRERARVYPDSERIKAVTEGRGNGLSSEPPPPAEQSPAAVPLSA